MAARGDSDEGAAPGGDDGGWQQPPMRKKLGRPLKDSPDTDSPGISEPERRRIQRYCHVASYTARALVLYLRILEWCVLLLHI